jgi:ERCC4-related helicase
MVEPSSHEYLKHPLIWPKAVESRVYQKKIADVASEKNTLVILPTALGKTIISAIVAADTLYNYRHTKVLVMAPTRPLVMQHRDTFMKTLKLREKDTVLLTGKTPPNLRKIIWEGEGRVVFSTPQVVRNDITAGRLNLHNYGLLVFDECHRAVKRYAYTEIAESYVSQARYPLILGMTASPGSDLNRVLEVCKNLYVEKVEYRSEEDSDVKPYIHPIEIEWKQVDLPAQYLEVGSYIKAMLDKRVNWLYNKGIIKRKPEYVTRRSLIEAGNELRYILEESIEEERSRVFTAIITQSLALTLFHMLILLETQGLHTLRDFLEKIEVEKQDKRSYAILASEPEYRKTRTYIENVDLEHPKAELLKKLVKEQIWQKPSSRILVFTQYRNTASHLVNELNRIEGIEADRFVGQASKTLDKGLSQEEQRERIKMLEDGTLNVLVATSIAEEGLDIPAVDCVVFYEPIPSEIRYIQRRGRTGRKGPGKVEILATNDTLDMIYLYASNRRAERMKRIAQTVNTKLTPIIRKRTKPPHNPLTSDELEAIEKIAIKVEAEPGIVKTEIESLKDLNRKAERASRSIYIKLLEQGRSGATFEQLSAEMEFEGTSPHVLKAALTKLIKEDYATEPEQGKYAATSAAAAKADNKTYEVLIEKIYPGLAVVIVNDKWRARLIHEEYNGPRNLIKKNSRFRAKAELYRLKGTLCISVDEVTAILK